MITGENIKLRALEPTDLDFLYQIENNTDFWEYGDSQTPYSRFVLKKYLKNSSKDIYEVKQLRMVITTLDDAFLGLIDLYDFDPKNKRVGLGIVIIDKEQRGKCFAFEAIHLLCDYAFMHFDVHQVFAIVLEDNAKSKKLFEKAGFINTAIKKDWVYFSNSFKDALLYQKIKS